MTKPLFIFLIVLRWLAFAFLSPSLAFVGSVLFSWVLSRAHIHPQEPLDMPYTLLLAGIFCNCFLGWMFVHLSFFFAPCSCPWKYISTLCSCSFWLCPILYTFLKNIFSHDYWLSFLNLLLIGSLVINCIKIYDDSDISS